MGRASVFFGWMLGIIFFVYGALPVVAQDEPVTIAQLKEAVLEFESGCYGKQMRDDLGEFECWVSDDGQLFRCASIPATGRGEQTSALEGAIDRTKQFTLSGQRFQDLKGGEPRFSAGFEGYSLSQFSTFLGISIADKAFFSEVFSMPGAKFEVNQPAGKQEPIQLVVLIPERGRYTFSFSTDVELRLIDVVVSKELGDQAYYGQHLVRVGGDDPAGNDSGGNAGPLTPYKQIVFQYGPIDYSNDGLPVKARYRCVGKSKNDGREVLLYDDPINIRWLGENTKKMIPGTVEFLDPVLAKAAVDAHVGLLHDDGLKYRLKNGQLVQVIDQIALEKMNKTRFRARSGSQAYLYTVGISILAIAIGSLLYYRTKLNR